MVQNEETIGEVVLLKLLLDIKTFNKNCGIISRKINVYESFYNKDPYGFEFLDGVFNLKTDYDFNVEMGNKLQDYYNENVFKHSNLNPGLVRIINSNKNEIIEILITIKDTYKLKPSEIKAINDACNILDNNKYNYLGQIINKK